MIGVLKNISAGWFVQYSVMRDEITSGYDSLPLHPIDVKRIQKNSQHFDNTEARIAANPIVNFEIIEVNVDTGALEAPHIGVKYAKLVPINEQTNGERFDEFMRTVEGYPELEGTMNLCNDIIEKRTGKMTEEEWQAAENRLKPKYTPGKGISFYIAKEISDEEIEKGAKEWYNKEGAYSASAIALKTWVYAIRWYREQLNK